MDTNNEWGYWVDFDDISGNIVKRKYVENNNNEVYNNDIYEKYSEKYKYYDVGCIDCMNYIGCINRGSSRVFDIIVDSSKNVKGVVFWVFAVVIYGVLWK
tara:strand:- start:313 stop:612 length:300 start_codon:yes stop_codon:yes gene_type:complete